MGPLVLRFADVNVKGAHAVQLQLLLAGCREPGPSTTAERDKCHPRKSSICNLHRQLTCSPNNSRAGLSLLHRSSQKLWL